MKDFASINDSDIATILLEGGIGVLRTDTLYGVVACASDESAVRKIYDVKGRDATKSPIVLIADPEQMFDPLSQEQKSLTQHYWPGKTSIIVPSTKAPEWIRRANASVAYRLPDNDELRKLLEVTGPLVAPSANPEGRMPAMNINDAKVYFGRTVDFYVDGGVVTDKTPSQLLSIQPDGSLERLR